MANSAITSYSILLKEVAKDLSKNDVEDMTYFLKFGAASGISTSTQLLREMEKQDMLDEDNLDTLKELLEQHNHKRLAKKVKEFEAAQKSKPSLSKTWPTAAFTQQNAVSADKARSQSVSTEQAMQDSVAPGMQQCYPNPQGVAPPGYYDNPSSMQPQMGQRVVDMYPQQPLLLQSHPGDGHPMQARHPNQPNQPNQPVHMANSYYQAPQNGNPYQPGLGYPSYGPNVNGGNIQHSEGKLRLQNGGNPSSAAQYTGTPGNQQSTGTQPASEPHSRMQSNPQPPGHPQAQGYNIPPDPAKVSSEPENMGHNAAVTGPYQTGRVRADLSVESNLSKTVATQPVSSQSMGNAERLLLSSEYGTGKLFDLRRVDCFDNGLYQVKILEGMHVQTSEGGRVILDYNTDYAIKLLNNDPCLRCSAVVNYNGKFAGDWTVDPRASIVIERPAMEERKFHFVDARCAPAGSGVTQGDPNNGLIRVVFTPEKPTTGTLNDLSRGLGNIGLEPDTDDYFGMDNAIPSVNDVQRSLVGPPATDWHAGATILHGRSSQQFKTSEHFDLDEKGRKVIEFKLVGRR